MYTKSAPPRVLSNLFLFLSNGVRVCKLSGECLRRACYDTKDRNALVYTHKTSKNVKMNFFEFLPKICKKAGKILTPWMSCILKTGRREKLCLLCVDARVFIYSM